MHAVLMVACATAICYGIRGWYTPMWFMLGVASVVAGAKLLQESK